MSWAPEQRAEFAKVLGLTAKMFDKQLDVDIAKMIIDDLDGLDYFHCILALRAFRKDPKNKSWPRAADIRSMVSPVVDDQMQAIEAAARIMTAIKKFGYTNSQDAREYIGPLGWSVIEKQGGWAVICETTTDFNQGVFQAQAREIAKAQIQRARAGVDDLPPILPMPIGAEIKKIEMPENVRQLLTAKKMGDE